MYTALFPYLFGVLLAGLTVRPARRLSPRSELRFLRTIMVGVAFGFVGFPLSSGDWVGVRAELAALAVFVFLLLGTRFTMVLLAVTYFVHGLWDLAYLTGLVMIDKPVWVSELCVPYDWLIAGYVVYCLTRREPASEVVPAS